MDDVEARIGYQLKRAQHAFRLATDAALLPLGLTTAQYAALSGIGDTPGISSAALARYAFVTAQTMNEIVTLLAIAGFVERKSHPTNRRVIQLFLSRTGEELLAQADRRVLEVEQRMVVGLDRQAQQQLFEWLRVCTEALS